MDFTNKPYEKLTVTPVGVEVDGNILTGSVEKTCRIDSINVTVDTFIDGGTIDQKFDFTLE